MKINLVVQIICLYLHCSIKKGRDVSHKGLEGILRYARLSALRPTYIFF
jgi:hypothetical protein